MTVVRLTAKKWGKDSPWPAQHRREVLLLFDEIQWMVFYKRPPQEIEVCLDKLRALTQERAFPPR